MCSGNAFLIEFYLFLSFSAFLVLSSGKDGKIVISWIKVYLSLLTNFKMAKVNIKRYSQKMLIFLRFFEHFWAHKTFGTVEPANDGCQADAAMWSMVGWGRAAAGGKKGTRGHRGETTCEGIKSRQYINVNTWREKYEVLHTGHQRAPVRVGESNDAF